MSGLVKAALSLLVIHVNYPELLALLPHNTATKGKTSMNDTQSTNSSVPIWFWVVSIVALLWNLLGVMAFFGQVMMPPEMLEAMPQAQRSLFENMPAWAYAGFAAGVFGGALGCIALLIRQKWARILFIISLAGVIIQNINAFFVQDSYSVFGPGGTVMVLLVIVVAIVLIWFSGYARDKGWLN